MKKLHFWLLAAVLMFLQSCSVQTDITYHKDKSQSILMDWDMKEFLAQMKEMDNDKKSKKKKPKNDFEKLPKEWTSVYEMELKEGKKMTKNPDSIALMKKIFVKGNYQKDEFTGMAFRMDRVSEEEAKALSKELSKGKDTYFQDIDKDWHWDGKTLKISTKDWHQQDDENDELNAKDFSKLAQLLKMKFNIRFDEPIEAIKGKHDWIKQIDDKTLEIHINFDEIGKKLKHNDENIIITTK